MRTRVARGLIVVFGVYGAMAALQSEAPAARLDSSLGLGGSLIPPDETQLASADAIIVRQDGSVVVTASAGEVAAPVSFAAAGALPSLPNLAETPSAVVSNSGVSVDLPSIAAAHPSDDGLKLRSDMMLSASGFGSSPGLVSGGGAVSAEVAADVAAPAEEETASETPPVPADEAADTSAPADNTAAAPVEPSGSSAVTPPPPVDEPPSVEDTPPPPRALAAASVPEPWSLALLGLGLAALGLRRRI